MIPFGMFVPRGHVVGVVGVIGVVVVFAVVFY